MENVAKNNDTLGDLYALRAGLSIISQNADEYTKMHKQCVSKKMEHIKKRNWQMSFGGRTIDGDEVGEWVTCDHKDFLELEKLKEKFGCDDSHFEEEVIKEFGCDINDLEYESEEYKKAEKIYERLQAEQNKIGEEIFCEWLKTNELNDYIAETKEDRAIYSENKKKLAKKKQVLMSIVAVILCLCIVAVIVGKVVSIVPLVVVGILLAVICLVGIFFINRQRKEAKKISINVSEKLNKFDTCINNIEECRDIINKCDDKYQPIMRDISETGNSVYIALEKEFGKLVDVRDWKYIDVLIYYFETGRADSIKEALQLLEREIQTERIIGAIDSATKRIRSAIKIAVNTISGQLGVISNQLTQSIALQKTQIAQTQMLLSQENMRNALIAKSNVTSEKLMQDVEYIKNYGIKAYIQ
ncbi:MAG: hypothetical protein K2J75_05955 [Clostridia bacterium]|nr:hypothetical protein [Clostridia bacterium]